MLRCSFCGREIQPGVGKMFVKTSGEILYFCSSKCERNWMLKRDPKLVKWTKIHRKLKGKE